MDKPIGIFDSGVGGLTVASAVQKLLPEERIVYYGDTRHSPYGDKNQATIQEYSRRISKFLMSKDCKAIVIACNSASAAAYNYLQELYPEIPIFNVISPAVKAVSKNDYRKIGVVATRATIHSDVYRSQLLSVKKGLEVICRATPLLAPIVEEGFADTEISRGAIRRYLGEPGFEGLDALILGCTHYPLLIKEFNDYFGPDVKILNSAVLVALSLREELQKLGMLSKTASKLQHSFYLSEKTATFSQIATRFFGRDIELEEWPLLA